ncbi:DNA alkylation repair protein [Actinoplanes sp. NPDC051494]|uniref:DNA alkylation repair protein n=1 Tax=Actinoplanes sp. NPDC051494 TaxID=3363907 RepID=UPI0037B9B427
MSSSLTTAVVARLVPAFGRARDPRRAVAAAAYMRDRFPFLGIATPARRILSREVVAGLPTPSPDDLRQVALACWELPEREYQYFACDYLRTHAAVPGPDFIGTARELIVTHSWWDTVDPLSTRFVGTLVRRHPALTATMDEWAADDNMWLVRTAILHQLHHGAATDTDRLFDYCDMQAGHPDFFVRKAIGWALRHHARTDPDAVRGYLAGHRAHLSPLSVREASKHL